MTALTEENTSYACTKTSSNKTNNLEFNFTITTNMILSSYGYW